MGHGAEPRKLADLALMSSHPGVPAGSTPVKAYGRGDALLVQLSNFKSLADSGELGTNFLKVWPSAKTRNKNIWRLRRSRPLQAPACFPDAARIKPLESPGCPVPGHPAGPLGWAASLNSVPGQSPAPVKELRPCAPSVIGEQVFTPAPARYSSGRPGNGAGWCRR